MVYIKKYSDIKLHKIIILRNMNQFVFIYHYFSTVSPTIYNLFPAILSTL